MGLLPHLRSCFSLYFFLYYFYFPFNKNLSLWAICKGNGRKGDKPRKPPEVNFSTHSNISRQAVNRITFIRLLPATAVLVKGLSLCPLCMAEWWAAQALGTHHRAPTTTEVELALWVNNSVRPKRKTGFQHALQNTGRCWGYPFNSNVDHQQRARWTTKILLPTMNVPPMNCGMHQIFTMLTTWVVKTARLEMGVLTS